MSSATPHRALFRLGFSAAAAALWGIQPGECTAQERASVQLAGPYPYAQSVLAAPKSVRAEALHKNLSEPAVATIAPDAPGSSALAIPERRTAVDQMMQSHEFTFGTGSRSNFSSKRPPVGTNMDMDAIKLRVSRDKVLFKAE